MQAHGRLLSRAWAPGAGPGHKNVDGGDRCRSSGLAPNPVRERKPGLARKLQPLPLQVGGSNLVPAVQASRQAGLTAFRQSRTPRPRPFPGRAPTPGRRRRAREPQGAYGPRSRGNEAVQQRQSAGLILTLPFRDRPIQVESRATWFLIPGTEPVPGGNFVLPGDLRESSSVGLGSCSPGWGRGRVR